VLLAAAGCNYFMAVPMGDDVMLSYQCTSYHDAAALRAVLQLRPAPEFERWCEQRGILWGGKLTADAGKPKSLLRRKTAFARSFRPPRSTA
jgi:ethanolamine ammonia-lyase large subunit